MLLYPLKKILKLKYPLNRAAERCRQSARSSYVTRSTLLDQQKVGLTHCHVTIVSQIVLTLF